MKKDQGVSLVLMCYLHVRYLLLLYIEDEVGWEGKVVVGTRCHLECHVSAYIVLQVNQGAIDIGLWHISFANDEIPWFVFHGVIVGFYNARDLHEVFSLLIIEIIDVLLMMAYGPCKEL